MHTDKQPTLRQLMLLKSLSGKHVRIIDEIAAYWKYFGVYLDFDEMGYTLDCIDRDHQSNVQLCCQQMMREWLNGNSRQPATWATLIERLKVVGHCSLAKHVEDVVLSLKDDGKARRWKV